MRSEIVAFALCAAVLAGGCGGSGSAPTAVTNAAPMPNPPVPKAAPPVQPVETGLTITGPIIVEHQVDVTAQRDGVLAKVLFDAPARVQAGTILARLDDRQISADLEAARSKSRSIAADLKNWQAEAQVLEADYGRAQRLWDLGLISQEQLQHAQYKAESDQWDIKRVAELLNTAQNEERSLELELEKTKIIAPFDGVIARRYVREGQSVTKGERLFWVTAEAPLLVRFTLPENFFGKMRGGQQVDVTSADAPGEKHLARVKQVSPVVDPSSGTFEVLVELIGERGSLRPGMTASVHLGNSR